MELSKYLTKEENELSVLKNIPIDQLKEVQTKVGAMIKVVNHYSSVCQVKTRYVFRGPRHYVTPFFTNKKQKANSTRKADAKTVSVYFDVKVTCPGLSSDARESLREIVRKNFAEML